LYTYDYESWGVESRPKYPPVPVSVAIQHDDEPPVFLSWGHASGNTSTKQEAYLALKAMYDSGEPILAHNHRFEMDISETHFGLPKLPWQRIEETQFLLFLFSPHAPDLSLKPSSERLLGMPPDEQDAVKEYLITHQPIPGVRISASSKSEHYFARYIQACPAEIVGPYCLSDVDRTYRLYQKIHPTFDSKMLEAYDRERRLLPVLLKNEREGVRVDVERLERDITLAQRDRETVDNWLRVRLGDPGINIDSDPEIAKILEDQKIVTMWALTPTGKHSTRKDLLTMDRFSDPEVWKALNYRNRIQTMLSTFMEPWQQMSAACGGKIHTSWNQVRGTDYGARTGRLSTSKPNLLNVPKRITGSELYPTTIEGLSGIPHPRRYLVPDEGGVWLRRDYCAQEPRLTAHFADGAYQEAFRQNPKLDPHAFVAQSASDASGREVNRNQGKVLNLALTYGFGLDKMAAALGVTVALARTMRDAFWASLPDVAALDKAVKARGRRGESVRTWGGRLMPCPPAGFNKKFGKHMTYEYRMLNQLIQGSAADMMKEAMIRYDAHPKLGRFLVSVYDEINISAPEQHATDEMEILREVMSSVKCDVPMLSDGEMGSSWGELRKYVDSQDLT